MDFRSPLAALSNESPRTGLDSVINNISHRLIEQLYLYSTNKGKQSRFTVAQVEQIQREFGEEKNRTALAKKWGISRGYLYKLAAKVEASPA